MVPSQAAYFVHKLKHGSRRVLYCTVSYFSVYWGKWNTPWTWQKRGKGVIRKRENILPLVTTTGSNFSLPNEHRQRYTNCYYCVKTNTWFVEVSRFKRGAQKSCRDFYHASITLCSYSSSPLPSLLLVTAKFAIVQKIKRRERPTCIAELMAVQNRTKCSTNAA